MNNETNQQLDETPPASAVVTADPGLEQDSAATAEPLLRGNGFRALVVLTVMLALLSALGLVSFALYTDSESVATNSFTSGGIDLTVSPGSALVSLNTPPMSPGDQYTAPLTVGNAGTVDLRYAMTSTTTEDVLAGELVMTIKSGVTTCDNANWAASGSSIYSGVLGTVATSNILGSNAQGADTGDRTITAAGSEVLCFNVTLPLAATNASQGITSTATFTFDAEQTDNNS
ncbi:MAG: TasA family protein [Acidimicrobiales bacterium]